jgi:hypothetical protein
MSLILTTALSGGSVKAAQGRITRVGGANSMQQPHRLQ